MIIRITNVANRTITGRVESGNDETLGLLVIAPGTIEFDSRNSDPDKEINFVSLYQIGNWWLSDYSNAKLLQITVMNWIGGATRVFSIETY